jgi:lipoprotein LpqH
MVRGLIVGIGGAAVVAAGLVGCSSDKKTEVAGEKPAAPSSVASATSGTVTAAAGSGTAKVMIDGQPKDVTGQIACTNAAGNFTIAIGDTATGIGVVMSPDASKVTQVTLGNVNGVVLGYQDGASGDASASATKDGNTYKVTGKATGVDMTNPMQPVTKPFEIAVTCP